MTTNWYLIIWDDRVGNYSVYYETSVPSYKVLSKSFPDLGTVTTDNMDLILKPSHMWYHIFSFWSISVKIKKGLFGLLQGL